MNTKKTLVLGASENPSRYANMAVKRLLQYDIPVVAVGYKEGNIEGVKIQKEFPSREEIDTVTLYLSRKNQEQYYDDIVALKPRRVIFNPGTSNPEFEKRLTENNIDVVPACTLVMLSTKEY
ncbi:MAG: CoA-binding protein [Brumimicrobium sp.]|nr:CoA-binding protein [Brumimicrobium sp.]